VGTWLFVTLLIFEKVRFCHFRCRLSKGRDIENLQIGMDRPIISANTDTLLSFHLSFLAKRHSRNQKFSGIPIYSYTFCPENNFF
jgi:hypothetical protein